VVSSVIDGDTVWVRPEGGGKPRPVRLQGIDAPEICQAFGPQSKEALSALLLNRRVLVSGDTLDDNQRMLARIRLGRQDVGEWMVTRGYAWSYRFRKDPGPYAREEQRARAAQVGLWAESNPLLPREFRVRHGSCARIPPR